jgi:hypothetical protein
MKSKKSDLYQEFCEMVLHSQMRRNFNINKEISPAAMEEKITGEFTFCGCLSNSYFSRQGN